MKKLRQLTVALLACALWATPSLADSYYMLSQHGRNGPMPPMPFNNAPKAPKYEVEPGIWLVADVPATKEEIASVSLTLFEQIKDARENAALDAEALRLKPVVPKPVKQYRPMADKAGHQTVYYGNRKVLINTNDPNFSLWFYERRFPGISTNFSPELRAISRSNQPKYIIEVGYPEPKDQTKKVGPYKLDREEAHRLIELQKAKEKATGVAPTEPVLLKSSSITHPGWPFDTNAVAGYVLEVTPQRAPNTPSFSVGENWGGLGDTNVTIEDMPVGLTTLLTFFDDGTNGKTVITQYYTNHAAAIQVDLEDYKEFELGIEYPAIVAYESAAFQAWLASFDPDCVNYPNQPTMVNGDNMVHGQTGGYWKFAPQEPCWAPWPSWASNVFLYYVGSGSWAPDLDPWIMDKLTSSNPYIAYPPSSFPSSTLPPPPIIGGGGKSFWGGTWKNKPTVDNPGGGFPGSPGPQFVQTDISGYSQIEVAPTNTSAFYFMCPTNSN